MSKEAEKQDQSKQIINKDKIMDQTSSAYEAVVAIAKEARRLNAVPGIYLEEGEKAIPRAVRNFVDGKVEYEIDHDHPVPSKSRKKGRKSK